MAIALANGRLGFSSYLALSATSTYVLAVGSLGFVIGHGNFARTFYTVGFEFLATL